MRRSFLSYRQKEVASATFFYVTTKEPVRGVWSFRGGKQVILH